MIKKRLFLSMAFLASVLTMSSQDLFAEYANMFTAPNNYVVGYTNTPPHIDGNINDEVWAKAQWTETFLDIEGESKPKPYHETKVKMLWDDNYLYFAVELKEDHVWATLTKRDEIVFFDNDFEIFLDPNNSTHKYFEIEINALNNIFDLFLAKPYRFGGGVLFSWNTEGMKHAVSIQGSLNNSTDKDESWTVEIALPFSAVTIGNNKHLPKDGETWRLNFSRVQWLTDVVDGKYVKQKNKDGANKPEQNWVWSPQGVIDMHRPERWGYLQFSKNLAGSKLPDFTLPYHEQQRKYLWLLHYKQQTYRGKHGKYAKTLKDLDMHKMDVVIDGKKNTLSMLAIDNSYEARINDNESRGVRIDNEGEITF